MSLRTFFPNKYITVNNSYGLLIWRLALVFLIYSLSRLCFYWYNADLLHIDSFKSFLFICQGGIRFDLTAILYLNSLVILLHTFPLPFRTKKGYQKVIKYTYFICNIPAFIFNLGDVVYYRFTLKRTTISVFSEFQNENPFHFLRFFWDYWEVTLIGVFLICLWYILYELLRSKYKPSKVSKAVYYTISCIGFALSIYLTVVGIRGGTGMSTRPINASNASFYINEPQQQALVLNTPFTMIRSIGKDRLIKQSYFPAEICQIYFTANYQPDTTVIQRGLFKGKNVVLIIWESFAKEWVGALNKDIKDYQGFTPFIDSLLQQSFYFERAYAGGTQSIDAMPALLASIARPQVPFISSIYAGNKVTSLAKELNQAGYYTAFFHNAENGSMGFDAFARHLSFKDYYGKDEYDDDSQYDGNWGIWDEPFLQYFAQQLNTFKQPFFATEFTTTSHHPYKVPKQYEGKFPKGNIPMHQVIGYTDYALRKFFETAQKMPWYKNTLFVITADHAVGGSLQAYKTPVGRYSIPFIFFDPNGILKGKDSTTIVQQTDLLPTLLSLLGIDKELITFGHNMFSSQESHFAVTMLDGIYQLIIDQYALQYDGENVVGFYNLALDPQMKHNLKDSDKEKVKNYLPKLQAFIQELSSRLIQNKLTLD